MRTGYNCVAVVRFTADMTSQYQRRGASTEVAATVV